MSKAIEDVLAERRRQIEQEGWTADHDDSDHGQGQLARAAATYAYASTLHDQEVKDHHNGMYGLARGFASLICDLWPWAPHWFKHKTARGDLVKAGALIVAEIERLDRLSAKQS